MKYNQETYETIKERILSNMSLDIDRREGSFVNNMISPVGTEFAKYYIELDSILAIMFLEDATNEYLDKKVNDFAVYRKKGTSATGEIQVIGKAETYISKGTVVLSQGELEFYTLADTWLKDGINTIEVEASDVGAKYNIIANSIDKFAIENNNIESINNAKEFEGGADRESDEELKERFLEIVRKPATSGNVYHYEQWAKEVDGINQAKVKPLWNGNGTVKVIVSNNNSVIDTETLNKCKEHIENSKPIGALVTVVSPTQLNLTISANVKVASDTSLDEVKKLFIENLNAYISDIEEEVTYTRIASCLGSISSVKDYKDLKVNNTTSNIPFNDEQIPSIQSVNLGVYQ